MIEKKLTKAELKKREEIAKAVERDNPNMTIDKKMAIATATAKRVAEDAPATSTTSVAGAGDDKIVPVRLKKKKKLKDVIMFRRKELESVKESKKGELDEISKKTLSSYIKKASKSSSSAGQLRGDAAQRANTAKSAEDQKKSRERATKMADVQKKREAGIDKAVDRLSEAEEPLSAHETGRLSYKFGRSIEHNPHKPGSVDHKAWTKGFKHGKEAEKKRDPRYRMESTNEEKEHFQAGSEAAKGGVGYNNNPHPMGSMARLDWSKGHNDARAQLVKRVAANESTEQLDEFWPMIAKGVKKVADYVSKKQKAKAISKVQMKQTQLPLAKTKKTGFMDKPVLSVFKKHPKRKEILRKINRVDLPKGGDTINRSSTGLGRVFGKSKNESYEGDTKIKSFFEFREGLTPKEKDKRMDTIRRSVASAQDKRRAAEKRAQKQAMADMED